MRPLLLIILGVVACAPCAHATTPFAHYRDSIKRDFAEYRQRKRTAFEEFRRERNCEFAEMLGRDWQQYKGVKTAPRPRIPEPDVPPVAPDVAPTRPRPLPSPTVTPAPPRIDDIPLTVSPIPTVKPGANTLTVEFYGTPCRVRRPAAGTFALRGTTPRQVSDAWRHASQSADAEGLVDDCVRLRESLNLCDYAFMQLVDRIARAYAPDSPDLQAFIATYLLTQTGYDTRLMKVGGILRTTFHPDVELSAKISVTVDGKQYYILGDDPEYTASFYTYPDNFSRQSIPVRMTMTRVPQLARTGGNATFTTSRHWTAAPPFSVAANTSLIGFLNDYPQLPWQCYPTAALSDEIRTQVLPRLAALIDGMNETEAAQTLLGFMQNAFNYRTDGDQFGYERSFFVDENFYYPYNDCEDRAILYSVLVRELLGLKSVLLYYPLHLATAVHFSTPVPGDYVVVDGERYTVCDPTLSGGLIGQTMDVCRDKKARAIKLQ